MAEIYVGLFEVHPERGCEVVDEEVAGAFARCYVVERTEVAAEAKMRRHLEEQLFAVDATEFCKSCRGTEWENPESPEVADCLREAEESGEVVLGRLDTWTDED